MALGFLMIDLEGTSLLSHEEAVLNHPMVAGVILFARNYQDPKQLKNLVSAIREVRPELLIAVDQEGGRVQRFQNGFTTLPSLHTFGQLYDHKPEEAIELVADYGFIMASELTEMDIDFSFAPVLDLNYGVSEVIGDRSFHRNPSAVTTLARAYISGMHKAGMAAVGKHFPGHGYVSLDSHHVLPLDDRSFEEIYQADLQPFKALVNDLSAIMPAHIIYPKVDELPAGFSQVWLQKILRAELKFKGCIVSDDLSMEGAAILGDYPLRVKAALKAGCDLILICNNPKAVQQVLQHTDSYHYEQDAKCLLNLKWKPTLKNSIYDVISHEITTRH